MPVRRSLSPMLPVSTPSTTMLPPAGSVMRKRAAMMLLLPLPVRPTMPTRSPAPTSKLTPFSTSGRPLS